jgi:tRNA1(Val) A37 N6-methylase TrmN6
MTTAELPGDEITHDTLLRGRVKLLQPARGFRSSLDPVLLAGFAGTPCGRFLDIGCGTGALAFLLLARDPGASGLGVEIQPRLAALAARGLEENDFARRFAVLAADVREPGRVPAAAFDLVVTNPPFRPLGTGVLPPQAERSLAHHEVTLTLADWLAVAAAALRPDGRLCAIYPAERLPELRAGLAERQLHAARIRMVEPHAGSPPNRVLVEARRGTGEAVSEPPLILHEGSGYSREVRAMLGEK